MAYLDVQENRNLLWKPNFSKKGNAWFLGKTMKTILRMWKWMRSILQDRKRRMDLGSFNLKTG